MVLVGVSWALFYLLVKVVELPFDTSALIVAVVFILLGLVMGERPRSSRNPRSASSEGVWDYLDRKIRLSTQDMKPPPQRWGRNSYGSSLWRLNSFIDERMLSVSPVPSED